MPLIKSISGIRGTIGGKIGDNLTPVDVVKFVSAYGSWLKAQTSKENYKVVVGRDARISGDMMERLVTATLSGLGIDVVNLGLSTTPTVEMAVPLERADGGIVITASHNPKQWNALKLLNAAGEFLNASEGKEVLHRAEAGNFSFAEVEQLGKITRRDDYIDIHIDYILKLPLVGVEKVKTARFKVVVDAVNSTGGIAVPRLLEKLGVEVIPLYCEPTGDFPHDPEPLREHLTEISERVVREKADLGFVVDPDVDRLAIVCHDGEMFGEEYTLVACADYVLGRVTGCTVSNLSSSRALRDITGKHGGTYKAAAVGEVNVVACMKAHTAVIGGEGNGGVIYPNLHYGRDALVGIALFLTHLAETGLTAKALRDGYPAYYMSKQKVALSPGFDADAVLEGLRAKYASGDISTVDGLKIDFPESWVHLRKSNTEPIVRIYTEAASQQEADALAERFIGEIEAMAKGG